MNLQIWRNYFSELIHGLWTKRKLNMYDINHLGDYFFDDIVNLLPTPLRDQTQREGE